MGSPCVGLVKGLVGKVVQLLGGCVPGTCVPKSPLGTKSSLLGEEMQP